MPDVRVDVNVVSAGSNDPANPKLKTNLENIHSRARRVIWILPIERARAKVRAVSLHECPRSSPLQTRFACSEDFGFLPWVCEHAVG